MGMGSGTIDTYGCPEFFVDVSEIEVIGDNVRLSFGVRRGDRVQGQFSMVMPVEAAMICSRVCNQITQSAFNAIQMMEDRERVAH